MKYVDYENQVNNEIMFNLQISFQDAERYIDPEFLRAPEGERATFGSFSIGKFGNNISIIGFTPFKLSSLFQYLRANFKFLFLSLVPSKQFQASLVK